MEHPKITIDQLTRLESDPKTKRLRQRLIDKRKEADRICAHVNSYKKPLLKQFNLYNDFNREGRERITDPERVYLSKDEEQVRAFFDACNEAHKAHGYDVQEDHCPALTAKCEVNDAERALFEHFRTYVPQFPATVCGNLDNWRNLMNLLTNPPRHTA